MYNRFLLNLLVVSFLFIQSLYSQNIRISPINPIPSSQDENFAQTPPLGTEPTNGFTYYEDMRVLPFKGTGGGFYTVFEDGTDVNTNTYSNNTVYGTHKVIVEQKDANNTYLGHGIAYLPLGMSSTYNAYRKLKIIDATVNDQGDIAMLLYFECHKADQEIMIYSKSFTTNGSNPSQTGVSLTPNSTYVSGEQGDIRYGYVVVRRAYSGFFSTTRVDILDKSDYDIFTPRFIAMGSTGSSFYIAGIVDYNKRFLRSNPINTGVDDANKKDIVITSLGTSTYGSATLGLYRRLSTNQNPFGGTSSGSIENTNDVLGMAIDNENNGGPYVYLRHAISPDPTNSELRIDGYPGPHILNLNTLPISRGSYIFSVYYANSGGLAWGTNSRSNPHPFHQVSDLTGAPGALNRVYRNLIAVRQGQVSILGHFDNNGVNFYYGSTPLLPSPLAPSSKGNNTMIASFGADLGTLLWSRTLTGSGEQPISIDTDLGGNIYFTSTYSFGVGGARILPLDNVLSSTKFVNIQVSKLNPCGQVFWTRPLVNSNNLPAINRSSFAFSNSNEIYHTLQGEVSDLHGYSTVNTKDQYILKFRDIPLKVCEAQLFESRSIPDETLIDVTWASDCSNPTLSNGSDYTATTDGNYSAFGSLSGTQHYSNAVWLDVVKEDLEFDIVGENAVCNTGTTPLTYTIQHLYPNATYTWSLIDASQTVTTLVSNSSLSTQNISWFGRNTGIYRLRVTAHFSMANNTSCEVTKELEVVVSNQAPVIPVIQAQTYCLGSAPASVSLLTSSSGVIYQWSVWQNGLQLSTNVAQDYISSFVGGNVSAYPNQLPLGTTIFKATKLYATTGCVSEDEVAITITPELTVNLEIPEAQICLTDRPILLTGASLAGGIYSGLGVSAVRDASNNITGYQFDPANLLPDEYEITYTYDQNGCSATATDVIRVVGNSNYQIQAFGCAREYNSSEKIEIALLPRLAAGHIIKFEIPDGVTATSFITREYTSGTYWDINDLGFPVPIGTQIKVTIINNNDCGGVIINHNSVVNEATITVVEAPAKDIYLKDHPFDFGQQPSGGGYGSPSITITQVAPNFNADVTTTSIDPNTGVSRTIKFYYNNGATGNYNVARNIVDAHNGNIRSGEPNYLYLRVFNRCKSFGKGLRVDALYFPASTAPVPGGLLTEPIPIPQDIEGGGEVIIAIPIENYRVASLGSYHTCSMARIYQARPGIDDLEIFETPGFDLFGRGISESNNMTWRNINIISSTQGEGTIDISNDGLTPKMARIKFDFAENQDPANAHYLENNGFRISLPYGLVQRWQQNDYTNNNLSFVNNTPSLLEISEPRNAWFEVLLMPGEKYTLGLSFDIRPVTSSTPPQESVYHLDITQHNEGELVGGVGYDLMIDFPDLPPVTPINLNASVFSSSRIDLSWVDASDNELVFILERSKSGGAYVHVANINADETSYTDNGLDPYTLYRYRIKAISATGLVSGYVYSPQVRTLDIAPTAPTNLTASLRSDCKIDLNWEDNASNEYRYEVVRILNGVSTSVSTNIAANTRSYVDNISVSTGATYTYKVRARSSTGLYSSYAEVELVISTPAAPVNFTAGIVSDGEVQLSWGSVPAMGTYHLEKKVGATWTSLVSLAGTATNYTDGVSAAQQYEYRLRGRLGCIFSSYTTQSVTMPALPAPTNFTGVYNFSTNSISLSWTDNAVSESVYILERIPLGGNATTITLGAGIGSGTTLSYTDANLDNYPSYTYRLYAQTALGVVSLVVEKEIALQVSVSGYIRNHATGAFVGNVIVDLVDTNGNVLSQITDSNGYYSFNVAHYASFSIHPHKNTDMMNGVTNADLITAEIIDFNNTSPYLRIAADLNGDCMVNEYDYYLLRLALKPRLPVINFSVPSWQFVSSDYVFPVGSHCPFESARSYTSITSDLINQDFIGVKTGDITGDTNSLLKVSTSSHKEVELASLELKVVPNPFSNQTNLVFGSSVSTSATVRVYTSLGVEIYTDLISVSEGSNSYTLSIKASAGLYYVHVTGEGINYITKLIVEK